MSELCESCQDVWDSGLSLLRECEACGRVKAKYEVESYFMDLWGWAVKGCPECGSSDWMWGFFSEEEPEDAWSGDYMICWSCKYGETTDVAKAEVAAIRDREFFTEAIRPEKLGFRFTEG